MTTIDWLQRHRTWARLMHRVPVIREWLSRRVWSELESDPVFVAGMEAGLADLNAGRMVHWDDTRWDKR